MKSEEPRKLTSGEQHVLQLIRKEAGPDGWSPVSKAVATLFVEQEPMRYSPMPRQLCEFEFIGDDGRGRARLTMEGKALLDSLAWL